MLSYVKLRKPFCINDLPKQHIFRDRYLAQNSVSSFENSRVHNFSIFCSRELYEILHRNNIPTPRHIYANRENGKVCDLKEFENHIEVNGERISKPFVEKPFDGEDHGVYIYYHKRDGGGSRRLFRKVQDKSSDYFPDENVRRGGSFVYEPFMPQTNDLKVYTIGPGYAHGEIRKSPTLDGKVERDPDNKELRFLTRMTREEKEIAMKIVTIFKQNICGLDIIRHGGRSYVIDVNGWSFVKGNMRYDSHQVYDLAYR